MGDKDQRSPWNIFHLDIYPWIQFRLVALVVASNLVPFALFAGFSVYQSRYMLNLARKAGIEDAVWNELFLYGSLILGMYVLGTLLLLLFTLLVAHRIVGPLDRLRDELETMLDQKQIHLLRVRDSDYLRFFFSTLNKVLVNLAWDAEGQNPMDEDEELDE